MARMEKLEAKLKDARGLDEGTRTELLALLESLRGDIGALDAEHGDRAESIAGFAGAATHEAIRTERNPALLKLALDGLSVSVKDMEAGHPKLVNTVNGICTMLSDLGI